MRFARCDLLQLPDDLQLLARLQQDEAMRPVLVISDLEAWARRLLVGAAGEQPLLAAALAVLAAASLTLPAAKMRVDRLGVSHGVIRG